MANDLEAIKAILQRHKKMLNEKIIDHTALAKDIPAMRVILPALKGIQCRFESKTVDVDRVLHEYMELIAEYQGTFEGRGKKFQITMEQLSVQGNRYIDAILSGIPAVIPSAGKGVFAGRGLNKGR
jgi:hypothetical protein